MSSSPNSSLIKLVADSGSPTVAISIVDGDYRTVAQGTGSLEVELPPGLYKIRYATGSNIVDDLFELSPQENPLYLRKYKLPIHSPAPLASSQHAVPDQEELAVRLSKEAAVPHGAGSELFVFVRDMPQASGECADATTSLPHPAAGLKLFDFDGNLIEDFGTLAVSSGCAGVNLALNPASYILRLERPENEALEQTIVTSQGWQTQVFLPLALLSTCETTRRPSLEDAAIFIAPLGQGFRADADQAAWVEMARTWLARGEPVVPWPRVKEALAEAEECHKQAANEEMLREMLRAKLTNPMLGIYAAHLMMIAPEPEHNETLMREVANNLKLLLGDHPDVTAITLWLDPQTKAAPLQSPPMLRSSWNILVNRSRTDEQLVPPHSYTLRITGRLWGTGAWLMWRTPPASEPATQAGSPTDLSALTEYIRKQLSGKTVSLLVHQEAEEKNLDSVEVAVLTYIANVVQGEILVSKLSERLEKSDLTLQARKTAEDSMAKDYMIQKLNIPQAALTEAIAGLFQKLRLK